MIFGRGPRLPSDVAVHLKPFGTLAVAELTDGGWAVVSTGALLIADASGIRGRHPWHTVQHGRWDGALHQFTVTWVDGAQRPLALTTATDEVESFATALRERVQSSVVHTETAQTTTGALVRAQIRRDEDGSLFSQLTAQGELVGDDDERRLIDALERRARAAVGLPT
ncbi:hypothetical protein [Georgenia yuyongxinii]|uniref:Uncharacterized protein n=1 Tax=Georgenia yuyongxinii TaxID=2589797 RepID=A0A552WVT7_9MICO|nr:hypothetical protein [Georgenia yuyongxinii]TRW46882.1 hypothetical protein FJ693_04010 [Georgenia yuyongxinii]